MEHVNPDETPRLDEHRGDGVLRATTRMEAFADAVFAIAFTLPIVEIGLPEAGPEFARRLIELWPAYLSYGLSTLVIGVYWAQHHFSGAIYRTAGHRFLLATLLFLASIGFIAFPTSAFAEHIINPYGRISGAQFYVGALSLTAVTWWIKWRTGVTQGEVDERIDPNYIHRLNRKYATTTALMVLALPLAFVRWEAGLALALVVTLYYVFPPETPVYLRSAPKIEGEA